MDSRHWAVLKVILLRPWTRFVLGFWLLSFIGICVPLSNLQNFRKPIVAIPEFDQPTPAIRRLEDVQQVSERTMERLRNVQFFDTAALPNASFESRGGQLWPAFAPKAAIGRLPVLQQLTGLKSLVVQPQHVIHADGWQDIGRLTQLESLWVQNTSVQSANESEKAQSAATTALSQLTKLRQLNVENARLAALPPMPNLEYVVLDAGLTLDQNLRTLSQHSPKLREIALRPYAEFELTSSMRDSLRRMPSLRTIWVWSGMTSETDRLTPQIAVMRAQLPGIRIRAGEYTRFRGMALFIFAGTMFLPLFIMPVHRSMMFSAPFAGYIPQYRAPHLFWPYLNSVVMIVSFMAICHLFNVAWFAALAIILGGVFFGSTPAIESPRWLARALRWLHLAIFLLTMSVSFVLTLAPLFADGFLAGDWPSLAALMIIATVVVIPFRVIGSTKSYRLLAELKTPIIPGLTLNAQQLVVASGDNVTWGRGLIQRQEERIDRRLQQSCSKDFTGRLMAVGGSPWFLCIVFLCMLMPHVILGRQTVLPVVFFSAQIILLGLVIAHWRTRSRRFSSEFLFPVSRNQFWRSIQIALLKDMLPVILVTVVGVFVVVCMEISHRPIPWTLLVPIVLFNGSGLLALFHALTLWACTLPRSWVAETVCSTVFTIAVCLVAPTVPLLLGDSNSNPIVILLSAIVVISGVLSQLFIRRRLRHCELGLLS